MNLYICEMISACTLLCDPKTFYQTPRKLTGKYASERYFFQNIRESKFRTVDPDEADLFFIPI